MTTKMIFATAIVSAFAAAACTAAVDGPTADGESVKSQEGDLSFNAVATPVGAVVHVKAPTIPPLTGGIFTTAVFNYSCSSQECTCSGDVDCNKMFSAGVCGGGILSTNCDTTNGVHCSCTRY